MPAATAIARTLRRAAVRAAAAGLVIAALSTRINPPASPEFSDGRPRPADHVIGDVQIDLTSIPAALESLRRAAPDHLALDPAPLAPDQARPLPPVSGTALHVRYVRARDVRLGVALDFVLRHAPGTTPIPARFEPTRIVIGGPGAAPTQNLVRRHDVRDLIKPAPNAVAATAAFCEGLVEASRTEVPQLPPADLVPHTWGGHVYLVGTADAQRAAERVLASLRQKQAAR